MRKDVCTPVQLTALVFCSYIFSLLTLPALSGENTATVMAGSAVSTGIQLLLLLPVILFFMRFKNTDPCCLAMQKSPAAGKLLTVAYLVYFLREAFLVAGDFGYYTDYFFPPSVSRYITPLCLALAGAYLASQKLSVIGKTGTVVFSALLFSVAVIAVSLISKSEFANLHFAVRDRTSAVMRCASQELSRCECPVLFSFLLPMMKQKESCAKTAVRYTLLKLAASAVIIGFTGMALGALVHYEKVPVFTAVTLADGGMIRRFDSFFLILWSMTAMVKLGLLVFCAAKCISLLGLKAGHFNACIISAAVPLMCAFPLMYSYEWESIVYGKLGVLPLIILAAVIPTAFLAFGRKEEFCAKQNTASSH